MVQATCDHIEIFGKKSITDYILEQEGRHFSEFNAIERMLYYFERDKYRFIEAQQLTGKERMVDNAYKIIHQSWSYSGLT